MTKKKSVTSPSQEYKSIGIGIRKFDLEKNLVHCDKYSFSNYNYCIGKQLVFITELF